MPLFIPVIQQQQYRGPLVKTRKIRNLAEAEFRRTAVVEGENSVLFFLSITRYIVLLYMWIVLELMNYSCM